MDYILLAEQESEGALNREDSASLLAALIYADLFDYPLTIDELTRYQVGTVADTSEVARILETEPLRGTVCSADGYYALTGRDEVFGLRQQRHAVSARIWHRYSRYRKWIARTPFVCMVAITGALAMNNISDKPDIDLMIVAQAGRVWICRRLLVLLVRVARIFGDELCPNYIISDACLHLDQRDFFTAHELAQMVLESGEAAYLRLLGANTWAHHFIPVAFAQKTASSGRQDRGPLGFAIARFLSMNLFDRWENWELSRMRAKLQPLIGHEAAEVVCSPDQCKGHTSHHRGFITARFRTRLSEYGLDDIAQRFLVDA